VTAARNPRLRAFYQYRIPRFHHDQLVFVDESGTDRRIGFRRTAWSQRQALARGDGYQIPPAYTSEGILAASIYRGATDTSTLEDFLKNILLPKCGQAKNSVIVMDNASIHHSESIRQLCAMQVSFWCTFRHTLLIRVLFETEGIRTKDSRAGGCTLTRRIGATRRSGNSRLSA
jgi:DDE superfamily endonuclease